MKPFSLSEKNIVIISNEPWSDIWFSKHNYAYELSKKNKVVFINPTKRWELKNLFKNSVTTEKYSNDLIILNYQNYLPSLNLLLFKLNNFLITRLIRKFFYEKNIHNLIFWSFDPFRLYHPQSLGSKLSIFHSVDKYLFTHFGEKLLYKNVDFIFCVSPSFKDSYKVFCNHVEVIPHGISSEEFIIEPKGARENDLGFSNYGLYVGNIDERLDYSLLDKVLIEFPDIDFVFVGKLGFLPDNKLAKKIFTDKKFSNVHFIGPKHFKKLKFYIENSSFCLALMSHSYPGNKIAHHKILQYLALGKPIFCSEFSDYETIKNIIYMNDNEKELMISLALFLKNGEDTSLKEKRIEYTKGFLFEENIKKVEKIISNK
jgi:hypothetical protein